MISYADYGTWSPRGRLLTVALALATAVGLVRLILRQLERRKYRFPPQVPGLPVIGNSFQVPPKPGPWALEMSRKYGEMFTIKLGTFNVVFLNSSRVVTDLMENRSAIYSSRPHMPMATDILSRGNRIVLMPYGERWRALRKIMHTILSKQQNTVFSPFQDIESKHLLHDYLHTPDKWYLPNQRFANSVIMSVVFGKRMDLEDPKIRDLFETSNALIANVRMGANIVDSLPILAKLPKCLQWWRGWGDAMYHKTVQLYRDEVRDLERRIANGTARDCFATRFLKDPSTKAWGDSQTYFALGSLMEAGSDTSRIGLSQAIAAAALDPRWVRKAVEELEEVCGKNAERLPNIEDRPRLPYISAVVKETFRWRPMVEIGLPHMLTQDDEYEGYRFPAGTLFTWNAYAIALNPDEYDDPERFMPERFLNEDVHNPLKGHFSFGTGRRICTGYNVGDTNVWMVLARILYCFNFEKIPGGPIEDMKINWFEHRRAPFPVKVTVRSEKHRELIERVGGEAQKRKY